MIFGRLGFVVIDSDNPNWDGRDAVVLTVDDDKTSTSVPVNEVENACHQALVYGEDPGALFAAEAMRMLLLAWLGLDRDQGQD